MTEIELAELPEKPERWSKKMIVHIRAGQPIGATGVYEIFDERGQKVKHILYGYRTGKDCSGKGFYLSHDDSGSTFLTWTELRAAYAAWREKMLNPPERNDDRKD